MNSEVLFKDNFYKIKLIPKEIILDTESVHFNNNDTVEDINKRIEFLNKQLDIISYKKAELLCRRQYQEDTAELIKINDEINSRIMAMQPFINKWIKSNNKYKYTEVIENGTYKYKITSEKIDDFFYVQDFFLISSIITELPKNKSAKMTIIKDDNHHFNSKKEAELYIEEIKNTFDKYYKTLYFSKTKPKIIKGYLVLFKYKENIFDGYECEESPLGNDCIIDF